jgi:hypothetical protein
LDFTPQEISNIKHQILAPISQAVSSVTLERFGQPINRLMINGLEEEPGGDILATVTFDLRDNSREFQAALRVPSQPDTNRKVEVQTISEAVSSPLSEYAEFRKSWARPSNLHDQVLDQWDRNFVGFNVEWLFARMPRKEFIAVYGTESVEEAAAVDRKGWPRFESWQIASLKSSTTEVHLRLQRLGRLFSIDRAIVDVNGDTPTVVSWISLDDSSTVNTVELARLRPLIVQWIIDTWD